MTSTQLNVLLSVLAVVGGAIAIGLVWQNERRRSTPSRLRHPAAPTPVSFVITTDEDGAARWQATVRSDAPPTSLDIVTYRPAGSALPWFSEPIIEPMRLVPGVPALLPSVIGDPDIAYDVVAAWTVHHPSGDVQGSRTLTVEPVFVDRRAPADDVPVIAGTATAPPRERRSVSATALVVLLVTAVVALAAIATWFLSDGDRSPGSSAPTLTSDTRPSATTTVTTTGSSAATATAAPTVPPSTPQSSPTSPTAPATTATTATTTPATTGETGAPETAAPPSSAPAPSTTPVTEPATTTTLDPSGRQVLITSRVEECRFGDACVVASFELVGFPVTGDYVCEFDDGSRFVFRYIGDGADDACARSGPNPSITIEVDGVRSATVTREQPGGT